MFKIDGRSGLKLKQWLNLEKNVLLSVVFD